MVEMRPDLSRIRANQVKPTPGRYMIVKGTSPAIIKHIKHPSGFDLSNPAGTAWPRDQYTYRRIMDGDIVEVK